MNVHTGFVGMMDNQIPDIESRVIELPSTMRT